MKLRKVLKYAGGAAVFLGVLVGVAWLLGVPSAKEPSYVFVMAWGEKGSNPGQFNEPTGIAVTDSEVFVSDARNSRIQVFDHEGRFRRQFGAGRLGRPMNLSIAKDELYVADYWHDRIQVFGLDGTPRQTIGRSGTGPGELNAPGGVAVGPDGSLYVADFYNQRIQKFAPDGTFLTAFGEHGDGPGQFDRAIAVAVAPGGMVFAVDYGNHRVQKWRPR